MHVFTLGDDGKIVEDRAIRDDLALMYQLAVVSGTGPQYDKFLQETKSSTG